MRIFILILALIFTTQAKADIRVDFSDQLCLALNIYFEDRQHKQIGMEGVAWVVLNRYNDINNRWPNTICGVVYEPSYYDHQPWRCSFSWTCDDKPDLVLERDKFKEAWRVAYQVLSDQRHSDPTLGALYYYDCDIHGRERWMDNIEFTVKLGGHCYFKDKEED